MGVGREAEAGGRGELNRGDVGRTAWDRCCDGSSNAGQVGRDTRSGGGNAVEYSGGVNVDGGSTTCIRWAVSTGVREYEGRSHAPRPTRTAARTKLSMCIILEGEGRNRGGTNLKVSTENERGEEARTMETSAVLATFICIR